MAISAKMQARQTQKQGMSQGLTMTPQLAQSIKLLQLNAVDLARHVAEEVEKNPLLEMRSDHPMAERGDAALASPPDEAEAMTVSADLDVSVNSLENKLGTSLSNEYDSDRSGGESPDRGPSASALGGKDFSAPAPQLSSLEDYVAEKPSLVTHLKEQLALTRASASIHEVASEIIDQLDVDGFFRQDMDALATSAKVDIETAQAALVMVQTFDPAGIAARDLGECLAIQLRDKNRFDPAMAGLVENLDLLAKRNFELLEEICGVSLDDLLDMADEIKALEPRPARAFDTTPVVEIVPEIFVTEKPDGSFAVELNEDTLPKVLVNQTYKAMIENNASGSAEATFITDCLQDANWLIRSLEQRANTILKTMAEIVRQQDAFFAYGVSHLRPMSMKQVADAIGMHESTISRVANGKFVQTSRGTFELRYFFASAIGSTGDGEAHSAEAVREKIRKLIDAETAESVLADDAIALELAKHQIKIARRTVAKYRESLGIASSVERAREKRAQLMRK